MHRSSLAAAVLALVLGAAACAGSAEDTRAGGGATDATAEPDEAPRVPDDFEVSVGQGGGVTGRWSGYGARADGTAWRWTESGGARTTTATGTLAPDSLAALWQRVEADALPAQADAPGNLTAAIETTARGETHRLAWAPGSHPDLDRLYAQLSARLETAVPPP